MIYDEDLEVKLPPAKTYNIKGKKMTEDVKNSTLEELIKEIELYRDGDRYFDFQLSAFRIAKMCRDLHVDYIIKSYFYLERQKEYQSMNEELASIGLR